MNLIDVSNLIKEAFKNGFVDVEVKARDYKNRCHVFAISYNMSNMDEKLINIANILGDGHRVISLTVK